MKNLFNNNKLQQSNTKKNIDEQGKYNQSLGHVRGNAATGEQVHTVRNYQTDNTMTFEEMETRWDEMNEEAKKWLDKNPGGCVDFITSRDTNGNEIVQVVSAKDPIFSGSNLVSVFNKDGNRIVGRENIMEEIQRRRAERDKWIGEGKVENVFNETHHTDDGWTSNVTYQAYPGNLHPNELNAESERLIGLATEKRRGQLGIESGQGLSEGVSKVKKPRTDKKESITPMDVDQFETSISKSPDNKQDEQLLTNDQLKELDEKQIKSLINQLQAELDKRKNNQVSSYSQLSANQLKDGLRRSEQLLDSYQISNLNVDNNGKFGIITAFASVSVLAIGGIAFVKNKLDKNKKK